MTSNGMDDRIRQNLKNFGSTGFSMPLVSDISADDNTRLLHIAQESLAVDSHLRLLLWLQGAVQSILPHDVLITLVGDFHKGRIEMDMVSSTPGLRTAGCLGCTTWPVSEEVFNRWQRNGHGVLALSGGIEHLITDSCLCAPGDMLRGMGSSLVHGLRDARTGEHALYVLMRREGQFEERQRGLLALLLPHIDHACRRVAALKRVVPTEPVATPETALSRLEASGLSQREVEILEWVRAGKTNHEIGLILDISAFTVKNHLQRIFRKIDVINRAQAVARFETLTRPE